MIGKMEYGHFEIIAQQAKRETCIVRPSAWRLVVCPVVTQISNRIACGAIHGIGIPQVRLERRQR